MILTYLLVYQLHLLLKPIFIQTIHIYHNIRPSCCTLGMIHFILKQYWTYKTKTKLAYIAPHYLYSLIKNKRGKNDS